MVFTRNSDWNNYCFNNPKMTLNTAIKRAIEQGYDYRESYESHALLDPQFWQCLAIASGQEFEMDKKSVINEDGHVSHWYKWKGNWHRFIDALASGKTADEAMGEIIK